MNTQPKIIHQALHYAARSDAPEVIRLLLENGANPWATDVGGEAALLWGPQHGDQVTPKLEISDFQTSTIFPEP